MNKIFGRLQEGSLVRRNSNSASAQCDSEHRPNVHAASCGGSGLSADGTIFVVDSDKRVLVSLENLLTTVGYRVRAYDAGESFLAAPKPESPCCVILDLKLGTFDGLDVQRQLSHETPMPVIFLTGFSSIRTTVKAMKAGACDILAKPVQEDELLWPFNLRYGSRSCNGKNAQ